MKESEYNYSVTIDKATEIIFNGRTKRFFMVSHENLFRFLEILKHPDAYKTQYAPFVMRMLNEGFVVNDEDDELEMIKKTYETYLRPNSFMLMILPTYQCNVRCWYCTQKHQDVRMSDDTLSRLKRHIKNELKNNKNIQDFYISWFGGEPLLEKEIIADVTSFAIDVCNKYGVEFSAGITTNGILFNAEVIKQFRLLGIRDYQITIDGFREQHNKVKRLEDKSAFDITLNNIKDIILLNPEARITLRLNYTDVCEPEKILTDVNSKIPKPLRKNITVSPHKVWQIDESRILRSTKDALMNTWKGHSYKYSGCQLGVCYVDRKHYETIFPNGGVGKCDNDDMSDCRGMLKEDGNVKWLSEYKFSNNSIFNETFPCHQCKHLPICWGPCPHERESMLDKKKSTCCPYENADSMIYDYIRDYINRFNLIK